MTITYVQFTKRTNFPKLGFIIDQLNRHGIPCRINGESAHAPILEVSEQFIDDAWSILDEPARVFGINADGDLDSIEDDDPFFVAAYARIEAGYAPDRNEEADWYEELNRGYSQDRI